MTKGFAQVLVIIFMSLLFLLGTITLMITRNHLASTNNFCAKTSAFYAAQAGLELAKTKLANNPNWHTDPVYSGSNKTSWLKDLAAGYQIKLEQTSCKIIRENKKNELYSIGSAKNSLVLLRLEFIAFPLQTTKWEEI
jgi:Tfp pilus assembly protein PilX